MHGSALILYTDDSAPSPRAHARIFGVLLGGASMLAKALSIYSEMSGCGVLVLSVVSVYTS